MAGSYSSPVRNGNSAQGKSQATVRTRSAPTSLRPGSSARSSTSLQANTVSPANSGATCRPPLIPATWNALASPLNESAGERDDMPAIDQPASEPPLRLGELVEGTRAVFCKTRRDLVFRLLDRHAVDVVDLSPTA